MNNQAEGERLRDEGHRKVIRHDRTWHDHALSLLGTVHLRNYTVEDIKPLIICLAGPPAHPNAWGALIRAAAKAGIIEDTGRCVKASNASAHARRLPVWRFK